MKRRRHKNLPFLQSALGFRLALGVLVAFGVVGFIHFNNVAQQFAPEAAHPYDMFADLCLGTVLVVLAIMLLGSGERVPRKLIRPRRILKVVQVRDGYHPRPYNGRAKSMRGTPEIIDAYFPSR